MKYIKFKFDTVTVLFKSSFNRLDTRRTFFFSNKKTPTKYMYRVTGKKIKIITAKHVK